ncbi:MAG: hemolysin family protein [Cyanobacteria bacterium J069]
MDESLVLSPFSLHLRMIPFSVSVVAVSVVQPLTASGILLRLLAVILLIAINAFFVAAEFSIVSVRQSRISQLVMAGDVQARTVQDLQRSLERLLSTAQLGITLSSLALGWIGEKTIAVLLQAGLNTLPLGATQPLVVPHAVSILAAFLLIAYLQIVLGELCPKAVALLYPEQLARFLGPPSLAIARFFKPFIWVLNQSTHWLLRLVGIRDSNQGWYSRVTTEELQLIIQTSSETSGLEEEERELLSNALEFSDVSVQAVMVPRISIDALPQDATFQDLLDAVADTGHSRYPVIGDSLDDILGIIYFKEIAAPLVQGQLTLESPITPWVRPAQFVPENLELSELLQLMQRSRQALVMVVDEFGGTAGLVTLKDLASEIIGYPDEPETPEEEPMIQRLDDHMLLVQAQITLDEVNEELDLNLPVLDDYQTLGGFLIHQMQKIPAQGESFRYGQLHFTVTSAVGPRLHQIRIERLSETGVEASATHPMNTSAFPLPSVQRSASAE